MRNRIGTIMAFAVLATVFMSHASGWAAQESATQEKVEKKADGKKEDKKEEKKKVEGDWGNLMGKITVNGDIPAQPLDGDKSEPSCLIDGKIPVDDNLIVGKKGELKDVVIMMYRKKDDPEPKIHPEYAEVFDEPVVADNKNCRFAPHVVMVQVGQKLELKNSDPVGHNCHGITFNTEFNVNVPTGKSEMVEIEEDADKAPGILKCDMHKWMDSVLVIKDNPYMTTTMDDGTFELNNIPAGTWKFQFWHVKCGYMKKLDIKGHKVGRRGEIEVTIAKDKDLDLGDMEIDIKDLDKK